MDFLLPNYTCIGCSSEINVSQRPNLCDECLSEIKYAKPSKISGKALLGKKTITEERGEEKVYIDNVFCPFIYKSPVLNIVMSLKYANEGLAAKVLAPYMLKTLDETRYDLIVPVPLSKKRRSERGYNQATILGKEISKHLSVELSEDILLKVKETIPQIDMTAIQRKENQKDAFILVNKQKIKGKRILVVDDVLTTGATLNECAKTLVKSGAKSVNVLVAALAGYQQQ